MISTIIATNQFADGLNEGGAFMYFILIAFLLSLFFIVMAFIKRNANQVTSKKYIDLAAEASILALVLGCLASIVGIIELFDMVESIGETRPDLFSAGLKVSLLTITFGLFSFTLARLGILIYKWTLKTEKNA